MTILGSTKTVSGIYFCTTWLFTIFRRESKQTKNEEKRTKGRRGVRKNARLVVLESRLFYTLSFHSCDNCGKSTYLLGDGSRYKHSPTLSPFRTISRQVNSRMLNGHQVYWCAPPIPSLQASHHLYYVGVYHRSVDTLHVRGKLANFRPEDHKSGQHVSP